MDKIMTKATEMIIKIENNGKERKTENQWK